jgi:hypothetical protein
MAYDRYASVRTENDFRMLPFGEIPKSKNDRIIIYKKGQIRLDQISSQYYDSPDYAWLILQANPELGSIENFITDGSVLRIPYPLEDTINIYLNDIKTYKELNQQ